MQGSIINKHSDIKSQLMILPDLVNLARDKNKSFIKELEQWFVKTEAILKKNNYSEVSELAGLRSRLYLSKYAEDRKANKTKQQMALGVELVYPAQNIVYNLIQPLDDKINEAKELVVELMQIAREAGMIQLSKDVDFSTYLNGLFSYFQNHDQLKSYSSKILSILGKTDTLRLIANQLSDK